MDPEHGAHSGMVLATCVRLLEYVFLPAVVIMAVLLWISSRRKPKDRPSAKKKVRLWWFLLPAVLFLGLMLVGVFFRAIYADQLHKLALQGAFGAEISFICDGYLFHHYHEGDGRTRSSVGVFPLVLFAVRGCTPRQEDAFGVCRFHGDTGGAFEPFAVAAHLPTALWRGQFRLPCHRIFYARPPISDGGMEPVGRCFRVGASDSSSVPCQAKRSASGFLFGEFRAVAIKNRSRSISSNGIFLMLFYPNSGINAVATAKYTNRDSVSTMAARESLSLFFMALFVTWAKPLSVFCYRVFLTVLRINIPNSCRRICGKKY